MTEEKQDLEEGDGSSPLLDDNAYCAQTRATDQMSQLMSLCSGSNVPTMLDLKPWLDHHVLVLTSKGVYQPGTVVKVDQTQCLVTVRLKQQSDTCVAVTVPLAEAPPTVIDDAIPHANQLTDGTPVCFRETLLDDRRYVTGVLDYSRQMMNCPPSNQQRRMYSVRSDANSCTVYLSRAHLRLLTAPWQDELDDIINLNTTVTSGVKSDESSTDSTAEELPTLMHGNSLSDKSIDLSTNKPSIPNLNTDDIGKANSNFHVRPSSHSFVPYSPPTSLNKLVNANVADPPIAASCSPVHFPPVSSLSNTPWNPSTLTPRLSSDCNQESSALVACVAVTTSPRSTDVHPKHFGSVSGHPFTGSARKPFYLSDHTAGSFSFPVVSQRPEGTSSGKYHPTSVRWGTGSSAMSSSLNVLAAHQRFKKGDVVKTQNGVRKKFNGKQWRRLCSRDGCSKESQRRGFCSRHLSMKGKEIRAMGYVAAVAALTSNESHYPRATSSTPFPVAKLQRTSCMLKPTNELTTQCGPIMAAPLTTSSCSVYPSRSLAHLPTVTMTPVSPNRSLIDQGPSESADSHCLLKTISESLPTVPTPLALLPVLLDSSTSKDVRPYSTDGIVGDGSGSEDLGSDSPDKSNKKDVPSSDQSTSDPAFHRGGNETVSESFGWNAANELVGHRHISAVHASVTPDLQLSRDVSTHEDVNDVFPSEPERDAGDANTASLLQHSAVSYLPALTFGCDQTGVCVDESSDCFSIGTAPSDQHVRRPMNAFIIFSMRHRGEVLRLYPTMDNRVASQILGEWWYKLGAADRAPYQKLARELKAAHFQYHPNWKWSTKERRKSVPLTNADAVVEMREHAVSRVSGKMIASRRLSLDSITDRRSIDQSVSYVDRDLKRSVTKSPSSTGITTTPISTDANSETLKNHSVTPTGLELLAHAVEYLNALESSGSQLPSDLFRDVGDPLPVRKHCQTSEWSLVQSSPVESVASSQSFGLSQMGDFRTTATFVRSSMSEPCSSLELHGSLSSSLDVLSVPSPPSSPLSTSGQLLAANNRNEIATSVFRSTLTSSVADDPPRLVVTLGKYKKDSPVINTAGSLVCTRTTQVPVNKLCWMTVPTSLLTPGCVLFGSPNSPPAVNLIPVNGDSPSTIPTNLTQVCVRTAPDSLANEPPRSAGSNGLVYLKPVLQLIQSSQMGSGNSLASNCVFCAQLHPVNLLPTVMSLPGSLPAAQFHLVTNSVCRTNESVTRTVQSISKPLSSTITTTQQSALSFGLTGSPPTNPPARLLEEKTEDSLFTTDVSPSRSNTDHLTPPELTAKESEVKQSGSVGTHMYSAEVLNPDLSPATKKQILSSDTRKCPTPDGSLNLNALGNTRLKRKPPPLDLTSAAAIDLDYDRSLEENTENCPQQYGSSDGGNSLNKDTMKTGATRRPFSANSVNRCAKRKLDQACETWMSLMNFRRRLSHLPQFIPNELPFLHRSVVSPKLLETPSLLQHCSKRTRTYKSNKSHAQESPGGLSASTSPAVAPTLSIVNDCVNHRSADMCPRDPEKSPPCDTTGNAFFGPDFTQNVVYTLRGRENQSVLLTPLTADRGERSDTSSIKQSSVSPGSSDSTSTGGKLVAAKRMLPIAPKPPHNFTTAHRRINQHLALTRKLTPTKTHLAIRRKLVLDLFQEHGLFPSVSTTISFQQRHLLHFPNRQTLQLKIREMRQRIMQSPSKQYPNESCRRGHLLSHHSELSEVGQQSGTCN
ncbi:hypothetical protein EG68_04607 [Paragonimus skrjabini miyazakii]|uniref:HMG box domain-containing protein n=1 Tax=Paragonimus skrjabini miyazakii TaxID=59628 RepID=A0A8S9YQ36_9TREM|nr:hypothetical protein EG68_04607 [Paragonimus skrjabini miyazakii]